MNFDWLSNISSFLYFYISLANAEEALKLNKNVDSSDKKNNEKTAATTTTTTNNNNNPADNRVKFKESEKKWMNSYSLTSNKNTQNSNNYEHESRSSLTLSPSIPIVYRSGQVL